MSGGALAQDSRYHRPRRYVSWGGLLAGLVTGIGAGLFIAWVLAPVQEFNTAPAQLHPEDKAHYAVAIMLAYEYDSDLVTVVNRLSALDVGGDPIQYIADTACDLARSGYVDSNAGLRAVRTMKTFYQLQGRTGCADTLIPDVEAPRIVEVIVPTATPTLTPPPSKTPTPEVAASPTATGVRLVPTTPPQRAYEGSIVNTFCDLELNGLIEVRVRDLGSEAIPGERIRVQWDGGEDTFVSGLKPERGADYADFQMEAGVSYLISMPGLSDPISQPIVATTCFTPGGDEAITSYRVVFLRVN